MRLSLPLSLLAAAFLAGAAHAELPDLGGREVVVVTENAYPPLQFVDPKSGEAIGWEYTPEEFEKIGAKILHAKYAFKRREGFELTSLRIPGRILETPSSTGLIDRSLIEETLKLMAEEYNNTT